MRNVTVASLVLLSLVAFHGALADDTTAKAASDDNGAKHAGGKPLYTVVDGYKVDSNTMNGFRAWRAAACDRCHGANQEGLVGPSLIESLKTMSKEDFVTTVRNGRVEKGMPSWSGSKMVTENIDNLWAYLKGRSNGDITRAHVEELKP
jgi:mono/diheme cytochrome c family protein